MTAPSAPGPTAGDAYRADVAPTIPTAEEIKRLVGQLRKMSATAFAPSEGRLAGRAADGLERLLAKTELIEQAAQASAAQALAWKAERDVQQQRADVAEQALDEAREAAFAAHLKADQEASRRRDAEARAKAAETEPEGAAEIADQAPEPRPVEWTPAMRTTGGVTYSFVLSQCPACQAFTPPGPVRACFDPECGWTQDITPGGPEAQPPAAE